jgi:hypothetical protein
MVDIEQDTGETWRSSPVTRYRGPVDEARDVVPEFERHAFAVAATGVSAAGTNPRLDAIVRLPHGDDRRAVPLGAVSKDYTLVQHRAVFDVAIDALSKAGVHPGDALADLRLTEYGERMALSVYLPERYQFDPGDGEPMALRMECFNSVEGSLRFRALMGWFRFVCSNGLVIGVTMRNVSYRHVSDMPLTGLGVVLRDGLEHYEVERRNFSSWLKKPVSLDTLEDWANTRVKDAWGAKAAARAFHIARTGRDAGVVGPFKGKKPTEVPANPAGPVPGAPPRSDNLFDVSQVLAWLAKERRDVAEQLEWRGQIPGLLAPLEAA